MMNSNLKLTAYVIFAAVVILLGYDCYAYIHGGVEATISWVIYDTSMDYPMIPFALGLLCGHLFGQMKKCD